MPGAPSEARSRILEGAREELAAVGQAVFSMEGVARRSFYSIGSVYNHWADRSSLLSDLAVESIGPQIDEGLSRCADASACMGWLIDEGRPQVMMLGEILLAGHSDDRVGRVARERWAHLMAILGKRLPESMAWYAATYAVGNALLDIIGLPGPDPATGRVRWLSDACGQRDSGPQPVWDRSLAGDFAVPGAPDVRYDDATTVALIAAAQSLLTEHGVQGASTRSIAQAAGVTTGAVYRRYQAKSRLFADVLMTELSPQRYAWTWDLIQAFASGDPYRSAADVMTSQLVKQGANVASQRVLLQIGIAARTDPALRAEIHNRIEAAHGARCEMFAHFIEVGLMRDDVDPAVFAWGFQTLPVGQRALAPLGIELDPPIVADAMTAILLAAARQHSSDSWE